MRNADRCGSASSDRAWADVEDKHEVVGNGARQQLAHTAVEKVQQGLRRWSMDKRRGLRLCMDVSEGMLRATPDQYRQRG